MKTAITLLLFYVIVTAGIYFFQRNFLYFPTSIYTALPQPGINPKLSEIDVTTQDGLNLKNWYAERGDKPFVIVFFHGNADSLRSAAPLADHFISSGYGYLLAEYRGYSGMPGSPTEDGLYADARAAIKHLMASGIQEHEIIFMGHSLGTGVAVQMATEFKAAGLILLAPYMSMAKMAQIRFPFIPAEMLTKDRFESFEKIGGINMPLLLIHGGSDIVVPTQEGLSLFEMAKEPKTKLIIPSAGHTNLFEYGAAKTIINWMGQIRR
jgi:fermentation-respiration switch protein FrsA (DUF1100 family)